MSILDDAIREHLELIRQRGADDSEVRRLEDEAFGPPTRPDEADFPESEEGHGSGNGVAVEEAAPEDAATHEDVTTLLPAEEVGEPAAETAGTGLEEPTGAHITGDVNEPEGEPVLGEPADEPVAEAAQEEPAAEEHPVVEEPQIEDAGEPLAESPEPAGEETAPPYDHSEGGDMDIDLDLTLEDEAEPEASPSEAPPAHEPEGAVPLEPPIESLDTVEHPFPDEVTESEAPHEEAAAPEQDDVPQPEPAPAEGDEEEGAEEGEDVLADTPEFLKDQPEDDELWFEQGEPKDFDF